MYKRQNYRPAINPTILRYPHKTSTLRSNRNISALKDGTLKSAEIINFWQSQSVDNQCLIFCQNVTSFTGKEKDSETGFYYFGARYYDPSLSGLFISVDPMADKYPSLSPYAYCAWNPVNLVDPEGKECGDYFDRKGKYLGSDDNKDAKIYILNEGQTLDENDDYNKKNTQTKFSEVEKSSDLYAMISAVYAEMGGADKDSKQIAAESIYNRANLPNGYEKADGTYKGVIKRAYDVAKPTDKRYDHYKNPQRHIYKNEKEHQAWIESASVAIKANIGICNLGSGVIFYNSASSSFYDNNDKMEKIPMPRKMTGIKGMWKLKQQQK